MNNYDHHHNRSFEKFYSCHSLSHIMVKVPFESGNKIFMPPSALNLLAYADNIQYPLLFELYNPSTDKATHCGVVEFTAEEGVIYIPNWIMEIMKIQEYDTVRLRNVSLLKGTYMKLQPHPKDFLELSNPKAVLETLLRNFSCLTTGDTILITYCDKKFYIDVIETKPSSAICTIETDCEVDFASPLDYKEPEKLVGNTSGVTQSHEAGKLVFGSNVVKESDEHLKNETVKRLEKFQPFTGRSYRLRD